MGLGLELDRPPSAPPPRSSLPLYLSRDRLSVCPSTEQSTDESHLSVLPPGGTLGPRVPTPSPIYLFLRRAAGMILCPCDFRHRSTMVMAVGRLKGEEDREHDVLYVCIFLLRLLFSISFAWMLVTEQALCTEGYSIILW